MNDNAKVTAKVGQVYSVRLSDEFWGIGGVVDNRKGELYLVLFDSMSPEPEYVDIAGLTPIVASSSLDAKIWHGHWPIIREGVDLSWIKKPYYKIKEGCEWIAESFDRKERTPLYGDIANHLSTRKTVSPIGLEKALKAHYGLAPWDSNYDKLLYENVLHSNRVLGK